MNCGADEGDFRDAARYRVLAPHLLASGDSYDEAAFTNVSLGPDADGGVEIIGIATRDVGEALDFAKFDPMADRQVEVIAVQIHPPRPALPPTVPAAVGGPTRESLTAERLDRVARTAVERIRSEAVHHEDSQLANELEMAAMDAGFELRAAAPTHGGAETDMSPILYKWRDDPEVQKLYDLSLVAQDDENDRTVAVLFDYLVARGQHAAMRVPPSATPTGTKE